MWDVTNGRSLILILSYVQKIQKHNCLRIELVKNSGTPGIFGDVQLRKFFGLKSAQFRKFKTLQKNTFFSGYQYLM